MHIQVLPHGKLTIQRKALRHVSDALFQLDAPGFHRAVEDVSLAMRGMQKSGEHLHRGGLAAAVRSDKTEYLSSWYGKRDIINRSKVTEFFGKVVCLNGGAVIRCYPWRCRKDPVPQAHLFGQHGDVCVFYGRLAGLFL